MSELSSPYRNDLNIKQLNFCKMYVRNGGNATQAYKAVYDSTDDGNAAAAACKLLKNPKVKKYLEKLYADAHKEFASDRDKIRACLWDIVDNPMEKTENVCRALDLLNKMDGNYVIQQKEEQKDSPLGDMTTEDIQRLLSEVS